MKTKIKIVAFLTLFYIAIFEFIPFLSFYFSEKLIEQKIYPHPFYKDNSTIEFKAIVPHIHFSGFGVKIYGLVENFKNSETISYNNPVALTLNPFTLNINLEYAGTANYQTSSKTINLPIDISISRLFVMDYDYNILSNIVNKDLLGLFNKIKALEYKLDNLKIYPNDSDKSNNLMDITNTKLYLEFERKEYASFEDIINNPPKSYNLSGMVNIRNVDEKMSHLPVSLILGKLPQQNFEGSFYTELYSEANKFDIYNPLTKAKLRILCDNCKAYFGEFSTNTSYDTTQEHVILDTDTKIKFSDAMYKNIPKWYFKYIKNLSAYDKNSALFLTDPEKNFPIITYDDFYQIKAKTDYSITSNNFTFDINNIILSAPSGSSIMLNGKVNLTSTFDYNIDTALILTGSEQMFNYWTDYIFSKFYSTAQLPEQISFYKDVNLKFVKLISEYPKSESKDIMLKLKFSSSDNNFYVGNKNLSDLINEYYTIKTKLLLANALQQNDPIGYVKKISPEISDYAQELLNIK